MSGQFPKYFIQETLIGGIEKVREDNPYLSFALIAIGIEFLGKTMNGKVSWYEGDSKEDFERAITKITSLQKYEKYLKRFNLWDSLRNGFSHSLIPKPPVSLSSLPNELQHESIYKINNTEILNLKSLEFYGDFKKACIEVCEKEYIDPNSKMNRPILFTP